jgi:hypothetical protein
MKNAAVIVLSVATLIVVGGGLWYYYHYYYQEKQGGQRLHSNVYNTNQPNKPYQPQTIPVNALTTALASINLQEQSQTLCVYPNGQTVSPQMNFTCPPNTGMEEYAVLTSQQIRQAEQFARHMSYPTAAEVVENDARPQNSFYTRHANFLVDMIDAGRGSFADQVISIYIMYIKQLFPTWNNSPTFNTIYHNAEVIVGFKFR